MSKRELESCKVCMRVGVCHPVFWGICEKKMRSMIKGVSEGLQCTALCVCVCVRVCLYLQAVWCSGTSAEALVNDIWWQT